MKKLATTEIEIADFQKDAKSAGEWINKTLKRIYRQMVEVFHVDFGYFSDIKIIDKQEVLKQLTQRMRSELKENGIAYSDSQWKQISEILSKNQITGFFENFAFYNPKNKVLYVSEKLIINYPEKMIPVCAHELSEKLLSTVLSTFSEAPVHALIKLYTEAKKTNGKKKLHELLNAHIDIIFKSVFKEGCCEAIALQTLRNIGYEKEVASLENELQIGYSKGMKLLRAVDNAMKTQEDTKKTLMPSSYEEDKTQPTDEEKLLKAVSTSSQIIKGISYYLGYPLAKAVLNKYGIEGVILALEKNPPLRAEYFANSQAYLTQLEKVQKVIGKRG